MEISFYHYLFIGHKERQDKCFLLFTIFKILMSLLSSKCDLWDSLFLISVYTHKFKCICSVSFAVNILIDVLIFPSIIGIFYEYC